MVNQIIIDVDRYCIYMLILVSTVTAEIIQGIIVYRMIMNALNTIQRFYRLPNYKDYQIDKSSRHQENKMF